ncbi:apoptosis antagonizing transcription factor-like protein, putative [Bodo saltans]|uniref:Apoptosis antagonizing transcription factor-like protein, putative n=1 Tax=Bodo saltans TaxID=75058 RepID=A0A0S4JJ09_BODSA|nr:apoptosis antagonizing transcription factor-like protein, putative [Bodo saltans]|eukprot:CUG90059.1 apoptosis antagonizing transcription factor-like protein, putative [Bodo saltans]
MAKKKQSIHDHFSAQLGLGESGHDAQFTEEDGLFTPIDVFDGMDGGAGDEYDNDEPVTKQRRVEKHRSTKATTRLRGPLDESLAKGAYDAIPVSMSDFDSTNVDDIFGMLDEGEGDAAEGDAFEDEDEYATWLEERAKKAPRKSRRSTAAASSGGDGQQQFAGATEDDIDILQQVAALRERQLAVVAESTADNDEATARSNDDRAAALRGLLDQYNQLLKLRVRLQPVVAKMVQFPQHYSLNGFTGANKPAKEAVGRLRNDVSDVLSSLRLVANKHEAAIYETPNEDGTIRKRPREEKGANKYTSLSNFHSLIMRRADSVLTHWSSKIVQGRQKGNGNKNLQAVNQPLVDQIRAITAAKTRLFGKVQRNRLHLKILGHPEHQKSQQERAIAIAEGDFDDEIFDDGEFVRELVQHSGAAAAKLAPVLQSHQSKIASQGGVSSLSTSKVGFHRKTKGKAVNYEPRPKLVGFMTRIPQPQESEAQLSALVASLFQ